MLTACSSLYVLPQVCVRNCLRVNRTCNFCSFCMCEDSKFLTAVNVKVIVLWDVIPRCLLEV